MASGSDWTTRKQRALDKLDRQLPDLITNYELKTRALNDLVRETTKLEDQKGKLEHEIKLAEQEAATADREFIEKKETMPDPFKPSKIYTVQDFVLFLFFVSYFILLVAVSMVFQEKMKTFFGGILILFFIVILFYRYL
jgi:hypothetical protein